MKIFYQTNSNDCGIAVTQCLIAHFHKKVVDYEEIYHESNIKEHGLSLLDFEKLNQKYGIELTSYELEFEEFKKHKVRDYFVLIVRKSWGAHYVIGKKNRKYVTLYDTDSGKKKLSYKELEKEFANVFIEIKPKSYPIVKKFLKIRNSVDVEKIGSLFLVNLCVFILQILSTFLMKFLYGNIANQWEIGIMIKLLFSLVVVYGIYYGGEYLESFLELRHTQHYSNQLFKKLTNSFKRKKNSFIQKIWKPQFLLIKDHIYNIAFYKAKYINGFLINIFSVFILGILLIRYINLIFLTIICFSLILQTFIYYVNKQINNKYLPEINQTNNDIKKNSFNLEAFLKNELNEEKLKSLVKLNQKAYFQENKWSTEFSTKQALINKLGQAFNQLFHIAIFGISSFQVFYQNRGIEYLIISNFIFERINKSFGDLMGYLFFKFKYQYSQKIYDQLLNIDLLNTVQKTKPKLPKIIEIKNLFYSVPNKIIFENLNLKIKPTTFIYGPSGIGKSVLYQIICGKLNPSEVSVYFDSLIPTEEFKKSFIIYQPNNSYIDSWILNKGLSNLCQEEKNQIIRICRDMNLDIGAIQEIENLSKGQKQLINLLNLFTYKNKVILLDEAISHINEKNQHKILQLLIPKVSKNNFLIWSEHRSELRKHFKHHINLADYK